MIRDSFTFSRIYYGGRCKIRGENESLVLYGFGINVVGTLLCSDEYD